MRVMLEDNGNPPAGDLGLTDRIKRECSGLPFGKILTSRALADRLGLRRSSTDDTVRFLEGFTCLHFISSRWRRVFGHPKTIARLKKEARHA